MPDDDNHVTNAAPQYKRPKSGGGSRGPGADYFKAIAERADEIAAAKAALLAAHRLRSLGVWPR